MEFGSPREKIEIVYEALNGRLNPKEASDNLFHCISCKKCSSACPYNIDTSKILWDNRRLFENCPRKYFFILAYVFSKLFRISYRG
jgi:Fe-S oxidoreductase